MLPNIGAPELVIILIVLLLVVGPGKLPEIGSAFGKTLREFRKASTELQETTEAATRLTEPPSRPAPPTQLAEPISTTSVVSGDDSQAVGVARNVSPRGTPDDAIEDA